MPAPQITKAQPSFMQRLASAFTPPRARPFQEMGVGGTSVYGGYVQTREKSAQWVGAQRYVTITDMAVNASIVAAGVHYFLNLIARPSWTVKPADESPEAKQHAEFFEEVLHGMGKPWSRAVRRAGTYRFYGFSVQEWTAARRPDGRIGLASVEPRPQHTVERWALSDSGAVEGVFQRSPQDGRLLGIPRSKIMYLVEDALSDSPEGVGIFRHLADSWDRLKAYQDLEARAFERDLRGIPVGRVPYSLLNDAVAAGAMTEARAKELVKAMEDFVKLQVKQSNTSITLDSQPYYSQAADGAKVAGVPQWGLELIQGSGTGVEAISAAIVRTQEEMARVLTCEHLLMGGAGGTGSRALSEDKSRNLYLIANAVLGDIAAAATADLVTPVWALNALPDEYKPTLEVEDVAFQDADTVAATLAKMAQAGAVLAPDDPVIEDVRALMGVQAPPPPAPEMIGAGSVSEMTDEEIGAEPEDEVEEEDLGKAYNPDQPRTLYVKRRLLNAGALRAWAAEQGIPSMLPAGDLHVTVAYSKKPVDWSALAPEQDAVVVNADMRRIHQFPAQGMPNGALVLGFESQRLRDRWQELLDAGASWDYAEYRPHVTITYSVFEAAVGKIEPYLGSLIFGPEEFEEVEEGWAGEVREEPLVKRSGPRLRSARQAS